MTTIRRSILASGIVLAILALIAASPGAAAGRRAAALRSATLDNLQAAYNGEANVRAKYLAFAAQADREGYPAVASLFRAAAEAEAVHANNFSLMIRQMGAKPIAKVETPTPKTTEENLRNAIAGETAERDATYAAYLKNAEAANIQVVVRAFTQTVRAEAEHAKLYTADLKALPKLKGRPAQQYSVCPTCGFITLKRTTKTCAACQTPLEKFKQVG